MSELKYCKDLLEENGWDIKSGKLNIIYENKDFPNYFITFLPNSIEIIKRSKQLWSIKINATVLEVYMIACRLLPWDNTFHNPRKELIQAKSQLKYIEHQIDLLKGQIKGQKEFRTEGQYLVNKLEKFFKNEKDGTYKFLYFDQEGK